MEQKFNPDLAPEMEWSECVLAASVKRPEAGEGCSVWVCCVCSGRLTLVNLERLTDTAQTFLDRGWRYRRTRTGIDAVCGECRR